MEPLALINKRVADELLATKQQQEKTAADLQALLAQPGWIFIEKVLKIHIETLEQAILNDDEMTQEQANELKKDRARYILFKTMPAATAQSLHQRSVNPEVNEDDVYA